MAEGILKKATVSRRIGYFHKTARGSHVVDVFISLIQTTELMNANPFDYLSELQKHNKEVARNLSRRMPWNHRETIGRAGE